MEIKPRPLEKTDIPDVLEISKTTWDGNDHLPNIIDSWFSDSEKHPFGIEKEGHVISVGNLHVIDEGQTGWMEGLRVHEKFRQQGLAKIMTDHLVKTAQKLNIPRIRYVCASISEAPMKLALSVGMKEISRYGVFWKAHLDQVDWSHSRISLNESGREEFSKAIRTHASMLPENALISHWDVYEATEPNITLIGEKARFWVGTELDEISSLSIGHIKDAHYGKDWCFTIYAKDVDSFKSTLSFHLNFARENDLGSIHGIYDEKFKNLENEIEWLNTIEFGFDMILYERRL